MIPSCKRHTSRRLVPGVERVEGRVLLSHGHAAHGVPVAHPADVGFSDPPYPGPNGNYAFEVDFAVETFIPAKTVKLPIFAMVKPGPHRHPKYPFDTTPAWVGGDNHGFRSSNPETPPYYTAFGDDMPFYNPYPNESFRTFQCVNIEFDVDNNGNYTGAAVDQWGNFVGLSTLFMPADNGKGLQLIDKDYADMSDMRIPSVTQLSGNTCFVNMDGSAFVPFYRRKIGQIAVSLLPSIQWHLTIALTATQTSLFYSVAGTRSKFPAMEIYMGTAPLLELSPRDVPFDGPYDGVDAYRSLWTTEQVPSALGVVPLTGYGPSPDTDSIKPIIN